MAGNDVVIRIRAATEKFDAAMGKLQGRLDKVASKAKTIGATAGAAFAGIAGSGIAATTAFARFDDQLRSVETLLNNNSFGKLPLEAGIKGMRGELKQLASTLPVSIDKLNKSLFDTISAGVPAGKAVKFLGAASKLAVAGVTDVSTATDGLTSAMNAFKINAEDADRTAALFFEAQRLGKTTVEELSNSIGNVAATASAFGLSLEEVLAATSAVTVGGVSTSQAMNGMKAAIANVVTPTEKARDVAKGLGIELGTVALDENGLIGFLEEVQKKAGNNTEVWNDLFGSLEAKNFVLALTKDGLKQVNDNLANMSDETRLANGFTAAFEKQNASLVNQFSKFQNKLQTLIIDVGERLAPAFERALAKTNKFIDVLKKDKTLLDSAINVGKYALALSGIVALALPLGVAISGIATAVGGLGTIFSIFGTGVAGAAALVSGPVGLGLVAATVAALSIDWGSAFSKMQEATQTFLGGFLDSTKEWLGGLFDVKSGVADFAKGFSDDLKAIPEQAADSLAGTSNALAKNMEDTDSTLTEKIASFGEKFATFYQTFKADTTTALTDVKNLWSTLMGETNEDIKDKLEERKTLFDEEQTAQLEGTLLRFENLNALKGEQQALEQESLVGHKELLEGIDNQDYEKRVKAEDKRWKDQEKKRVIETTKNEKDLVKKKLKENTIVKIAESEKVQAVGSASKELVALKDSEHGTLKSIGKAAAVAEILTGGIASAQNVIKALSVFGPPGIAAGNALGAALIVGSVERANKVRAFARGGLAEGGVRGRDSIPSVLTPGELVSPTKNFEEVIGSVRAKREAEKIGGDESESEGGSARVEIELTLADSAIEIIESRILENRALDVGVI